MKKTHTNRELPVILSAHMGSIAKKGVNNYVKQLQQHPLRTKAITAGALSGISELVSQKLTGIRKIQLRRLLLRAEIMQRRRSGPYEHKLFVVRPNRIFAGAYLGPFGHFFHIGLEKIFRGKRDSKTVAKKVLIEQLTASPLNNLLFLIYYGYVVEGRPWVHVRAKVRKDFPSVQYTSWTFWPAVGWISHQFLPLHFRVIFRFFVAFCWGIFLNLKARTLMLTKA